MLQFRINIQTPNRKALEAKLKAARRQGEVRKVVHILALLALHDGRLEQEIADLLGVNVKTVCEWKRLYLCYGIKSVESKKSPGRPPKLSKSQQREIADLIAAGPLAAGFRSACWRTPMIQDLIYQKFGVAYSVHYLSQWLKNLGFSYQKACFESDHLNEIARKKWKTKTWPEILKLAKERGAQILFGDEASFPQWGTLSYTWAKRGQQPVVKTSGKRKGYKVFGMIDYFSGQFFSMTTTERLNSASYEEFLSQVLAKTTAHLILIQDGAKYHTSAALKAFFEKHKERLTVYQLPSYSPDYNPIEKLWKKIKTQETHLHHFPTFESLVKKVDEALVRFENTQKEVLALFGLELAA